MQIPSSVWVVVVGVLLVNSFGITVCLSFLIMLVAFAAGIISVFSLTVWKDAKISYERMINQPIDFRKANLKLVVDGMRESEGRLRGAAIDKRLTGSREIDEPLQQVLGYIFHDYINSWYEELSDDADFLQSVQQTTQKTIVTLVNRMKNVDWMPFLTTRLVDDAASHLRLYRQAKTKTKQHETAGGSPVKKLHQLEKHFFDLELAMEQNKLCRDAVCLDTNNHNISQYLKDISEILLFLLLPEEDFQCEPMRMLLRDLLAHSALLPLFELVADPDFINQTIVSLAEMRRLAFTSDMLLNVLRTTDSAGELIGVVELLNKDIAKLRSCDLGLDDDRRIKQQLSSLLYTKKIIDTRLQKLQEGSEIDSAGIPSQTEWKKISASGPMVALPLEVLLKNNIALFYFIDFMMSIGAQAYLYFYLNVEGWRVSAEQQLSDLQLQKQTLEELRQDLEHNSDSDLIETIETVSSNLEAMQAQMTDNLKSAAKSICEQYLAEKASPRLKISDSAVSRLLDRINNEFPSETWFDEVQNAVYEILKTEDRFVAAFRQSYGYMKLLVDLELVKDPNRSDDEDSHSLDNLSDAVSHSSLEENSKIESTIEDESGKPTLTMLPPFTYRAEITQTGLANDHGNKYGFYCISVIKHSETSGMEEKWQVCRRYSDFLNIYQKIKDRYEDLGKVPFPSKKAFHNTERSTLEKRMKELNSWLQLILKQLGHLGPGSRDKYSDVTSWLQTFFQSGDYEQQGSRQFAKTMEQLFVKSFKSSLRTVGNVVRSVPETMSKAINSRVASRQTNLFESSKVGASLDVEANDNIPLRIMLLLLDEVFDLKSRNQWLRRRIVNIVRPIIKGMFGDIVNRRILEYVSWMTSPARVASYIEFFRDTFWPDGKRAHSESTRSESDKMRTRVLAKMALLASMTDEIKRIMGSETTRRGLLLVFEMFQQPKLNRRLTLVLFEGILVTLFPEHNFQEIIPKLHSLSERLQKSTKR